MLGSVEAHAWKGDTDGGKSVIAAIAIVRMRLAAGMWPELRPAWCPLGRPEYLRGGAQRFDSAHDEAHARLTFSLGVNVKVLLVEADVALRRSFATILMNAGIIVHQAGSATEALSLAPAIGHHDMLIFDHDLGEDISGFDLAGRIRERRPLAPLILICSQSRATPVFAIGPSDRLLAMPFGADS